MSNLNNAFLEEFKRLDKLCREMYDTEKGVTSYIDDMKLTPEYKSRYIPDWNNDLRKLKSLRHIRNQLSHEVGTLDMDMCEQDDIVWLRDFYKRILNGTDPLSILHTKTQHINNIKNTNQDIYRVNTSAYIYNNSEKRKSSGCLSAMITFFRTAFIILVCLLLAHIIWNEI